MHDNDNDNKQKTTQNQGRSGQLAEPGPNLKVAITRAWPIYTCTCTYYYVMQPALIFTSTKYYEMHRMQSNHARFDLLSRETCLTNQN